MTRNLRVASRGVAGRVGIALDGAELRRLGSGGREIGLVLGEAGQKLLGLGGLIRLDGRDGDVADREGERGGEQLAVAGGAAEHAVDVAEIAAQRHEQHAGAVAAAGALGLELQLDDRGLAHHHGQQAVEAGAVGLVDEIAGLHPAYLHAHHLADLHAGEADAHVVGGQPLDDEHVLERRFELARVDLGAIGRDPPGPKPFPVGLERGEHQIVHIET